MRENLSSLLNEKCVFFCVDKELPPASVPVFLPVVQQCDTGAFKPLLLLCFLSTAAVPAFFLCNSTQRSYYPLQSITYVHPFVTRLVLHALPLATSKREVMDRLLDVGSEPNRLKSMDVRRGQENMINYLLAVATSPAQIPTN